VSAGPAPEDFLSGASGFVAGPRRTAITRLTDAALDLRESHRGVRLRRAAAASPPQRRVLVLSVFRSDAPNLLPAARQEIERSRHVVRFAAAEAGTRGKFENLNQLLDRSSADGYDWLLMLDDDVRLPGGFLDAFVFLAERFELSIAQPAHRRYSHAAWPVTRRRPGSVVRETKFVEIGPVVAFHARTLTTLLPFPPLRAGWGLDNHWSAVAAQQAWRIGVIDATPVEHVLRPVAASYDHGAAVSEARSFLAGRPFVPRTEASRTLVTHRDW
jgi:hypothetical protein